MKHILILTLCALLLGCAVSQPTDSETGATQVDGSDTTNIESPNTNEEAGPAGEPSSSGTNSAAESPGLTEDIRSEATAVVEQFIERVAADDKQGADDLLLDLYEPSVDTLLAQFGWLIDESDLRYVVVPSAGWTVAQPVVVVSSERAAAAAAFVVGYDQDGTPNTIIRLPSPDSAVPEAGSAVAPGATIEFPGVPVEGGARAFLDGVEVPAAVDHEAWVTTVQLPEELPPTFVVVLSAATPEFPAASAIWFSSIS